MAYGIKVEQYKGDEGTGHWVGYSSQWETKEEAEKALEKAITFVKFGMECCEKPFYKWQSDEHGTTFNFYGTKGKQVKVRFTVMNF